MDQIGFEFTAEDRKLLESLSRFSHGLDDVRADSKKMVVDVNKAFQQIQREINQTQKQASGFRSTFAGIIAADAVRQGIGLVKSAGQQAISAAANYEQLQVAFGTFLGDADKANRLLDQLTQTAARTPFQQEEIFQGGRQLLAYGIEADKVNDILTDLGDISAGVAQPLSRIVTVFGQITAKGKLTGEELRQLREAGVNPIQELAQVLGVAGSEIEGLISKGKVTSEAVGKAFKIMTSEGGRFNDLMAKQSETFTGVQSNFSDSVSIMLRQFGDGLLPTLKEGLKAGIEFVQGLDPQKVKEFGASVGHIISIIAGAAKQMFFMVAGFAAFKVLGFALAKEGGLLALLKSGINGVGAAIKANPIGLIASVIVSLLPQITTLISRLRGISKVMEETSGAMKEMRANFIDETTSVSDAIKVLADLNSTAQERQKAYDLLNEKYPEILAKYDLEKGKLTDLIALQADLKAAIIDRLKEERLGEARKQLEKDLEEINKSKSLLVVTGGRHVGIATAADQENIRNARKSERLKDFQEETAIINKTADELAKVDDQVLGIRDKSFATLEDQQKAVDAARVNEVKLRNELIKLSDDDLRNLSRAKDTDEVRKKLAVEILKARIAEANKNHQNQADIDKAAKAMEKYRDAVQKAAEDLAKAGVENIQDPFQKLAAEKNLALNQSKILFDELRKQAKETGSDITEIEALETRTRLSIDKKYFLELQALQKEKREKDLAAFLQQTSLQRGISDQQITGNVPSNGLNTKDELTQVALLKSNRDQLQVELALTVQTFGQFAVESLEAQKNYNDAVAQLDAANKSNREAAMDRQEDLLLKEVDLIRRSTDSTLTLEEFKDKKRLEIQLEFAKQRLAVLQAEGFGENSIEVKQIRSVIAAFEHAISDVGKGDLFDKIKDKIAGIFNVDRDVIDQALQTFGQFFGNVQDLVSANTQFQIDEQQRILDDIRDKISQAESDLKTENDDKEKGYAANVESKKQQLAQLRVEEKKHQAELLKFQKNQLKQKLATDSLSQISSLITMVSNVVAAESGKGLLGIATGLTAITGFLLMFKTYKQQSKALAEKAALYKGGKIPAEGYTDHGGGRGHRIEGTNIVVGGGEMVVNRKTSGRHDDFLHDLNAGKFDHLDLGEMLSGYRKEPVKVISISRDLARKVSESNEKTIAARHRYDHHMRHDSMKDAFSGEMTRLMNFMEDQPQYIPWSKDMAGYIIKRKNKTIRRKIAG